MKKLINYLYETIKKEKYLLIFVIIIFLIGLVFGSLFINMITNADKKILTDQLTTYIQNIKTSNETVFGIKAFTGGLSNNLIQIVIIFILGISMLGIPVVIFIMFFKGFTLGTTLASMILKYKIKGALLSFLYVFPMLIINILIYIFISFFALNASIKFLKALLKKDNLNFKSFLGKYLLSFIISVILIIICTLLDAYLTPLLLKLFTYII